MTQEFDLVVIGSGPGGYVASIRGAQLGLKTACIESRATLGGTCLNVGCIPSKALLHASHLYEEAKAGHLTQWGVKFDGVALDLPAMLAAKDESVKALTDGVAFLFKKNKISWLKGHGRFKDAQTLEVVSEDGTEEIKAKKVIIATGSSVATLPGIAPDGDRILSSTEALDIQAVPDHMVIIGGGYIGLELGSVWRRLGTKITVVEYADRITPGLDGEVSKQFARLLTKQGMTLKTATKVVSVDSGPDGAKVIVEPAKGGDKEEIPCDIVLLSVGRKPNTDGLQLDKAGLAANEKGQIPIGHDFQTKVPGIYAIGDVVEGPMLAHKAEEEGVAAAEYCAGGTGHVNHAVIPAVVYTHPEVASVGKTEEELTSAGIAYTVGKFPFAANSRAKANKDTDGFVKILADPETDKVLGVHIIGSEAGTMIAEAALAMEFGASAEDVALTCHAHPTHTEAMKEAALAVHKRAIHI